MSNNIGNINLIGRNLLIERILQLFVLVRYLQLIKALFGGYQSSHRVTTRTLIPHVMKILPNTMQFQQRRITNEYTEITEELKHKVRFVASDPRSGGGQVQGEDKSGKIIAPAAEQVSVTTGSDGIARARVTLGKYTSASPYLRQDTDAAGNSYWEQTGLNLVSMSAQAKTGTISSDKPFEAYGKPAEAVSIEKVPSWSAGGPGLYSGYIWVKVLDKYDNSISNKKVNYEIKPQIFSGTPPTASNVQNAKLFKKLEDCGNNEVATINCPNLLPNKDNPANPIEFTSSYNGAIAYLVLGNTDDTTYTIKVSAKQDYFDQKGARTDTAFDISDIKPAPPAEFTYTLGHGDQTYLKVFHLQRSGDTGQLIDAGAAGTEFPITTQMFKFVETDGVYSVNPVSDGTVSFTICTNNTYMSCSPATSQGSFNPQLVTTPDIAGTNFYSTKLLLGSDPGLLYIRANGTASGVASTWAPIIVWNVKTSITSVPRLLINSDGYPVADTEIKYSIQPAEYTPSTIEVFFYENDEYMGMIQGTRDSAILSRGFAKFDPLFTYTFEVVLNRGPYEIRSARLPLPIAQFRIVAYDEPDKEMEGAVTDGAARLRLQLIAKENQQVFSGLTWRVVDPQFTGANYSTVARGSLLDSSGNPTEAVPVVFNSDGIAEAVYQSPDTFVRWGTSEEAKDKERPERYVQPTVDLVRYLLTGRDPFPPMRLKRPPVVLVHGLWGCGNKIGCSGSEYAWQTFESKLNEKGLYDIAAVNYYRPGVVLSIANLWVQDRFRNALDKVQEGVTDKGFSCAKVDIVAHSMGGLLTREYCQQSGVECQKRIRRFVSIATPHFGSELADLLLVYRDQRSYFPNNYNISLPIPVPIRCQTRVNMLVNGEWGVEPHPVSPVAGAIDDLATGRLPDFLSGITTRGRWSSYPPLSGILRAHTVVGDMPEPYDGYSFDIDSLWKYVLIPCGFTRGNVFGQGEPNDRIVRGSSQQELTLGNKTTLVNFTDHFSIRNADQTIENIKQLLDERVGYGSFTKE